MVGQDPSGIPPRRIGGVDVIRLIPVLPEPLIEIPVSDRDEYDFLKWNSQYGGTRPEWVCFRWLQRRGYKETWDFQFQCVSGHHRTLTADLRWVNISDVLPGDRLLSFDDKGPYRQWKVGVVLSNDRGYESCYLVRLSDGTEIICTREHPWLTSWNGTQISTGIDWRPTEKLHPGLRIPRFLKPWETETDFDSGWISGFFDGEGSLIQSAQSSHKGHQNHLRLGQNIGTALSHLDSLLEAKGVPHTIYYYPELARHENQGFVHITGMLAQKITFLGRFRPRRLLEKLNLNYLGLLKRVPDWDVCVESVVDIGKWPIYRLAVDNGTFLAEGFGMHNSSQMGGRQLAGGAVVDFEFPAFMLAWRIQGEKWHVGDPAKEAHDEMQKLSLASAGYTVVDVFAQDALERTDWVLGNAIIGIQVRTIGSP